VTTGNAYFNLNDPQTSYRVYAGIGLSFGAPPPADASRPFSGQASALK
jgi:hypothetical protein